MTPEVGIALTVGAPLLFPLFISIAQVMRVELSGAPRRTRAVRQRQVLIRGMLPVSVAALGVTVLSSLQMVGAREVTMGIVFLTLSLVGVVPCVMVERFTTMANAARRGRRLGPVLSAFGYMGISVLLAWASTIAKVFTVGA